MGTKRRPGRYDCHAKAAPDEPLFTLLARDPLAPGLVDLWAALRNHDWGGAQQCLARLHERAERLARERPEKIAEAMQCATDMDLWCAGPRRPDAGAPDKSEVERHSEEAAT